MYYTRAVSSFSSDRFHRRAQNKYIKYGKLQSNIVLLLVGIFRNNHTLAESSVYLKCQQRKTLSCLNLYRYFLLKKKKKRVLLK